MSKLTFPKTFTWGVATSSYQIEGAINEDGRKPSIWDIFSNTPGKTHNGDSGAVACEHYHRWQDDLDLIKSLGVNAYRFSVAWPRIKPDGTGPTNPKGLEFYDRLVDGMLERGIKPFCTLYHWDLPQVLEDAGGWLNRDTVDAFVEYADVVTGALGDRVTSYATLNEPWCSAFLGYAIGHHAPGIQDMKKSLQVTHHLLLAHGSALPVMRANAPEAQHGIVLNLMQVYPETQSAADVEAARRFDAFHDLLYLDPLFKGSYPQDVIEGLGNLAPDVQDGDLKTIAAPIDFLGLNYYTPAFVKDAPDAPYPHAEGVERDNVERTDMGWEVYPQGLEDLLLRLKRDYDLPLFITENGAAYPDELENNHVHDSARVRYFEQHLNATANAIAKGADVRGYFAWSLMDNFEWAFGYDKRFGIVHVDFNTQVRTLKDSAHYYRDVIKQQTQVVAG